MHPDVAHEISELIADLQFYSAQEWRDHRMGWALRLNDLLAADGDPAIKSGLVSDIVELVIPNEVDVHVRNELFDAVVAAARLTTLDVKLHALFHSVKEGDHAFICGLLLVMASITSDEWIPFVRQQMSHPNDFVRRNAEFAWKHHYAGRADKTSL